MGTRNLTMVIKNSEVKVAQYGQWDGYPSGQGVTALEFLRDKSNRDALNKALDKVEWLSEDDVSAFLLSIGCTDGWMNGYQSSQLHARYPFVSRDHGAGILQLIAESEAPKILLRDGSDFAADSLMCEWAYVVDLDRDTLEVYTGFNKSPLPSDERFAALEPARDDEYYPIKLVKTFPLSDLPSTVQFTEECESIESE